MSRIMIVLVALIAWIPQGSALSYNGCATQQFQNVVAPYRHFQPKYDSTRRIDLYLPNGSGPAPLIVYLHGGGWKGPNWQFNCHWQVNYEGNVEATGEGVWAINLLTQGWAIASVEYSEATAVPPTWGGKSDNVVRQVREIKHAIRWLKSQKNTYNLDTSKIVLSGGSAGGHLAALTALTEGESLYNPTVPAALANINARVNLVFAQAGIYDIGTYNTSHPWFTPLIPDTFGCYPTAISSLRPCSSDTIRQSSAVFHITADDPKVYLVHGVDDTGVPMQQANQFATALCAAGKLSYIYRMEGLAHNLDAALTNDYLGLLLTFQLGNQIAPNC